MIEWLDWGLTLLGLAATLPDDDKPPDQPKDAPRPANDNEPLPDAVAA